ncbi:MAG: helix-turn-helix domain-containing protein [Candidatus Omnitrophica bacterium]|nr:helix-turn-helix domain-containing protein [Candidatus Omnitrophota bacterium]
MSQSPYVTVREAAQILGLPEGKVMGLVEEKRLMAYRIADQYLRFKRSDILAMRDSGNVVSETVKFPYSPRERLSDFIVYNDFYILAALVILVLLGIVFFLP